MINNLAQAIHDSFEYSEGNGKFWGFFHIGWATVDIKKIAEERNLGGVIFVPTRSAELWEHLQKGGHVILPGSPTRSFNIDKIKTFNGAYRSLKKYSPIPAESNSIEIETALSEEMSGKNGNLWRCDYEVGNLKWSTTTYQGYLSGRRKPHALVFIKEEYNAIFRALTGDKIVTCGKNRLLVNFENYKNFFRNNSPEKFEIK